MVSRKLLRVLTVDVAKATRAVRQAVHYETKEPRSLSRRLRCASILLETGDRGGGRTNVDGDGGGATYIGDGETSHPGAIVLESEKNT